MNIGNLTAICLVAAVCLSACGKSDAPAAQEKSASVSAPVVGLSSGQAVAGKEDNCKAIQERNTNRGTLNYELQNAGCPPVDLSKQ